MSTTYTVKLRTTATLIAEILPLTIHERVQPPTTGVVLVLEDGKRLQWISEGGRTPSPNDFLIRAAFGGITFTVNPKEFAEMFSPVEEEKTNG